jgi:hypothetical protein
VGLPSSSCSGPSKSKRSSSPIALASVYRITAHKRRNGTITGRLHLDFSYQTLHYGWSLMLVGYVCQGNATLKAHPASESRT